MFKGFNLKGYQPDATFMESFKARGEIVTSASRQAVRAKLLDIVHSAATLNGSQIQNSWFPQISVDVFISHSHRNVDAALAFAGWLNDNFDLTAFVDSSVWDYAADLLKMIDDIYCWNSDTRTYIYENRNESTSHVYMMLSTALGMMIDKTECLVFLNTPDSISSSDVVTKTKSPWIYAELMTAGIVQETPPRRHQRIKVAASFSEGARQKSLSIEYAVPKLSRLTAISIGTLNAWANEPHLTNDEHALDVLYRVVADK